MAERICKYSSYTGYGKDKVFTYERVDKNYIRVKSEARANF